MLTCWLNTSLARPQLGGIFSGIADIISAATGAFATISGAAAPLTNVGIAPYAGIGVALPTFNGPYQGGPAGGYPSGYPNGYPGVYSGRIPGGYQGGYQGTVAVNYNVPNGYDVYVNGVPANIGGQIPVNTGFLGNPLQGNPNVLIPTIPGIFGNPQQGNPNGPNPTNPGFFGNPQQGNPNGVTPENSGLFGFGR